MAAYHFSKQLHVPLDQARPVVMSALRSHGFGILTEIDMQKTLKLKLGVDFHPYLILGACNPQMAYEALLAENKIGTMLPCNVILQEHEDGTTEVSAMDPIASLEPLNNLKLAGVAVNVGEMLRNIIDQLTVPTGS